MNLTDHNIKKDPVITPPWNLSHTSQKWHSETHRNTQLLVSRWRKQNCRPKLCSTAWSHQHYSTQTMCSCAKKRISLEPKQERKQLLSCPWVWNVPQKQMKLYFCCLQVWMCVSAVIGQSGRRRKHEEEQERSHGVSQQCKSPCSI